MNIGVLGGGQLAKMLAMAAEPLGIGIVCIDPDPEACAGELAQVITADFTDAAALSELLSAVERVTIETENIPLACAEQVAQSHVFYPAIAALAVSQDRLDEKSFFQAHGLPTAAFRAINSQADLEAGVAGLGLPAVLKTRRFGYDGKGQTVLRTPEDIAGSWHALGSQPLIFEQFLAFECEYSLIAVRAADGELAFYPLVRNYHRDGILRLSEVVFDQPALHAQAQGHAREIMQALDYVGVLTIEYFFDDEQLIANEMAPRVHNSGHWTIEGAATSQFENHLRAIAGLPLGSIEVAQSCCMVNCIGELLPREDCEALPGVHYHAYGKAVRPGRKVGHVTLVDSDSARYQDSQATLLRLASEKH